MVFIDQELVDLDYTGLSTQTLDNIRRTLQLISHITSENISTTLVRGYQKIPPKQFVRKTDSWTMYGDM